MTEVDNWVTNLQSAGEQRDQALIALRSLLVKGLHTALDGRAGVDAAFIEDITQTALVKIWEKIGTFQGRSKFTTWALSIAIRTAFSELRRKHWNDQSLEQMQENLQDDGTHTVAEISTNEHSASSQLIRNQYITLMHELISTRLTEKQRLVLNYELQGMPQDEIAAKLGSNRNAIYKLFHDARKALRTALEESGEGITAFRETFNLAEQEGAL